MYIERSGITIIINITYYYQYLSSSTVMHVRHLHVYSYNIGSFSEMNVLGVVLLFVERQ